MVMFPIWIKSGKHLIAAVLVIAGLVAIESFIFEKPRVWNWLSQSMTWFKTGVTEQPSVVLTESNEPIESLELSRKVIELNGIAIAVVTRPTRNRQLNLRGSLALDVNRLVHIRARFPGQIIDLATVDDPTILNGEEKTIQRPLNFMDRVTKGQRLSILQSKELGEKKSELADALSRLRLDFQTLAQLRTLLAQSATTERNVREAERQVEVDDIAVKRAERTLQSWLLTEGEIQAVKAESERIHEEGSSAQADFNWARVEIVSPFDGTIVEKNVVTGDLVDAGADLFKIADLSVLSAWAHVYEEDLAALHKMPVPIKWRLRFNSDPTQEEYVGTIDRIGEIVDPNEHMGLLAGIVANPTGSLRAGQFITATVELPPEPDVVEIPTRALVEDGIESVVLVQTDPQKPLFAKRRVSVARRHQDVVYVRSRLTPPEIDKGLQELHVGERVVAAGALELKSRFPRFRSQAPKTVRVTPVSSRQ